MATDVSTKQTGESQAEQTRAGLCFRPTVDIEERADELVITADMAGVRADSLDIDFEDGLLTIYGRVEPRHENANFLLREYGVGDFSRTFRVSQQVDSSKISAELADGVLRLHLPKAESAKPRKIQVQTS